MGHRAHLHAAVQAVADDDLARAPDETFDKALVDAALQEKRVGEMQTWPALRNFERTSMSSAASMSASSNTITGAWPPSSIFVRCAWSAASRIKCLPTAV
jgi:hypothetical protein